MGFIGKALVMILVSAGFAYLISQSFGFHASLIPLIILVPSIIGYKVLFSE